MKILRKHAIDLLTDFIEGKITESELEETTFSIIMHDNRVFENEFTEDLIHFLNTLDIQGNFTIEEFEALRSVAMQENFDYQQNDIYKDEFWNEVKGLISK